MAYRLSEVCALERMVERVRGVLMVRMVAGIEYTGQELLALCRLSGLEYTLAQYGQIAQMLVAEGMLDVV